MPPMTTLQTFIEALRTGKTRTMLGLDAIFTPPYDVQEWIEHIHTQDAFDDTVPGWAVAALAQKGVTGREIAHLNIWPNALKEEVRQFVVAAVDASNGVRFFWGLTDGQVPAWEPDTINGQIIVRFLTPRSAVSQAGPLEVDVGIYPPPASS